LRSNFLALRPAEAAIIAQECARSLKEAGVQADGITIARSEQDAMDLGGVLVILGGAGYHFIKGAIEGFGGAIGKALGRATVKAVEKLPEAIERILRSISMRHRTPVQITGPGGATWTIGSEFGRAPLAAGVDGGPDFGKLGIVILGASTFPYMNDATLNNTALARSAQLAKSLFSPPNTAFNGSAVLDLFDSEKQPVEVLDAIERHIDAHSDMRDLLIYYCGHGSFHRDDTYFLLLRTTRADRAMATGFTPRMLCDDLLDKRLLNKRIYFVVDACFSGAMIESMLTTTLDRTVREHLTLDMPQRGWSVPTASSKDKVARAPDGATYTMFTGALAHVIESGVGGAGVRFNLYDLCEEVRRHVKDRWQLRAVEPQCFAPRQDDGDVGRLPIFRNQRRAGTAVKNGGERHLDPIPPRKTTAASVRGHQSHDEPARSNVLPPPHPLDGMWYMEGDTGPVGPYDGYAIKKMIESGLIEAAKIIAKAGTTSWIALADSPVFAPYLQERKRKRTQEEARRLVEATRQKEQEEARKLVKTWFRKARPLWILGACMSLLSLAAGIGFFVLVPATAEGTIGGSLIFIFSLLVACALYQNYRNYHRILGALQQLGADEKLPGIFSETLDHDLGILGGWAYGREVLDKLRDYNAAAWRSRGGVPGD
jgi:hypothetical protein